MKDYGLCRSALGFGRETKMGYYCKTIDYGCAYDFAPHLVQLKWTHCQTIDWEIRMRCEIVTFACTDMEWFLEFLSPTRDPIVSPNPKWSDITLYFP